MSTEDESSNCTNSTKEYKGLLKNSGRSYYQDNINKFKVESITFPTVSPPKTRKAIEADLAPESSFLNTVQTKRCPLSWLVKFQISGMKIRNLEKDKSVIKLKLRAKTVVKKRIEERAEQLTLRLIEKKERVYKHTLKLKTDKIKRQRSKVQYYKTQGEKLQENISGLKETINELRSLIEDNKLVSTFDKHARKYTSEVQKCVYTLLDNNVSASNVGTVINACLKLVGREAEKTPAKSTVLEMNLQILALAQMQLSDKISDKA
ncbi:hypothetical protein MAR_022171 [Mya arenaria]|uniref:Uncharacterized protein n=1 Tax=Mya arenaria TaxID=6604 RepID=A0ABY7DNZ2_MYAAR|nr:hypothetical protein MAR_022171 [Mya arenaria]